MKLADLFSNFFNVRQELIDAVKGLTQEQLNWKPTGYANSIAGLLGHIAVCEYWWVTVLAMRKTQASEAEFSRFDNARTLTECLSLLNETLADMREYLEREEVEDWDQVFYESKPHDLRVSKRWLIWHTIEHQARHRGQIFMLMRLQGLDVPNV